MILLAIPIAIALNLSAILDAVDLIGNSRTLAVQRFQKVSKIRPKRLYRKRLRLFLSPLFPIQSIFLLCTTTTSFANNEQS
jgi:hypothetical protein